MTHPAQDPAQALAEDPTEDLAIDPLELAAELRNTIGTLVRRLWTEDVLPQNQAAVLGRLVREGPHSTSELAVLQRVRHQSMARTVALLTEAGLVEQHPHPTDARKYLLTPTPAGTQALHDQRARREATIAAAITGRLTPAEQRRLKEAVALIARLT
ncbi:MarR family transcriptional regulator [Kitasatospora sp. NPDC002227]|uniref:MarR family winged helix-turn-helix transcriptional regulator n=1 Tax=Kitasatospora sp. NPDC002227 TaxID=3154773 RepID=UPI00332F27EE